MSEQKKITQEQFDQQGQQLVEVENMYLDGEYDRQSIKRRIEQSKAIIGQQIYFMGRDLVMLKERCDHGEFQSDLNELGIHARVARRYMTIALKYNSPKLQKLVGSLNGEKGVFSKLLELATEGDEELEALMDGGTVAGLHLDDIDRMSATELRNALRKAQQKTDQDKQVNDRLIADKNQHADSLAKKLMTAQGIPENERWTEVQAVYDKELAAFALDAEELLNTVHSMILTVNIPVDDELLSQSARKSMALHSVNRINVLAAKIGQIQNDLFAEFSEFINHPTYSIADDLTLVDMDLEQS